jgi:hypothetical protein
MDQRDVLGALCLRDRAVLFSELTRLKRSRLSRPSTGRTCPIRSSMRQATPPVQSRV